MKDLMGRGTQEGHGTVASNQIWLMNNVLQYLFSLKQNI